MNEDENKVTEEIDFNRQNRENFEKLMEDSSIKKENYYDKNNPVVKVILLVLGGIIVVGAAYYIMTYLGTR